MDPITKHKRPHPTAERPYKKGTHTIPNIPLPFSFQEALMELKRRFEVEPSERMGNKIVAYLRKNFHQQFNHVTVTAVQALYEAMSQAPVVAAYIRLFAQKDKDFLYSRLPFELRHKIFSYLEPDDYEGARTFLRGDLNRFLVNWINANKCSFFDTIQHKPKALGHFVDNYGAEIKRLVVSQRFRFIQLEIEKFPNLTYLKLSHIFLAQFPEFVSRLPLGLKKLSYLRTGFTNNLELHSLSHLTDLQAISLKYTMFSLNYEGLEVLKQLTNFTALNLKGSSERGPDFYHRLASLNLVKLNLESTNLTFEKMGPFTSLTRLATLKIGGNHIGIIGKEIVGSLTTLTNLSLCRDRSNASIGFEHLSRLTLLTRLDVSHTRIEDDGSGVLRLFLHLRILDVHHTDITQEGLQNIAQLTNLTDLNLGENAISGGSNFLKCLTNLEVLDLKHHQKVALRFFKKMTRLRSLNLEDVTLNGKNLHELIKFTNLQVLNVIGSELNDKALLLFTFPRLKTLECGYNDITRQGVVPLLRLTNLTTLALDRTKIGNAGAEMLLMLPRLKHVSLTESCTFEAIQKVNKKIRSRTERR